MYVADVQNRLKILTCNWSEKINPLHSHNCCLATIIFITTSLMYEIIGPNELQKTSPIGQRESKPYDNLYQEIMMKITCSKNRLKTKEN